MAKRQLKIKQGSDINTVHAVETPKFINWRHLVRSFYYIVGVPAIEVIYRSIEAGSFKIDWKAAALAGIGGGLVYLIKKAAEPEKVVINKSELDK